VVRSCVGTGRQHPIVDVAVARPSNAFSRVTDARTCWCEVAIFNGFDTVLIYGDYYEYVRTRQGDKLLHSCGLHGAPER
jgi:hypothetical protein